MCHYSAYRRSFRAHVPFMALLWLLASPPAVSAQRQQAAPAKPTCETACRVNPVTAPRECACDTAAVPPPVADSVIVGGGGPGGGPPSPGLPSPGELTPAAVLDLMLVSYEREVAKIDNYYFVETTDIVPRPTVRYFEKEVEGGRSIFKEVPLAELAKREQLADPTLSAEQRAIAERPQVMLGGLATAFEFLAGGLGMGEAAKPFTDGLRALEADLDAGLGGLGDSADDVGGLLGPEAPALFLHRASTNGHGFVRHDPAGNRLVPVFLGPFSGHEEREMVMNAWSDVYENGIETIEGITSYTYPCQILSLPPNAVIEAGAPHRLVSADMWVCVPGRGVVKPMRTRVEYVTNAGDAVEAIVEGSQRVVIDQIAFEHFPVGTMRPAHKLVQSVEGLTEDLRIIRKVRRNFTVNKTPTQPDIVEAVGEDLGKAGPP